MPLFVSPTRPSIAPNVTSSSISPENYSLAAGQTLYSTTLEVLFDYLWDDTASFSNAGTMWADYSGQVYVLLAMYSDAIVNSGTMVAHSTGGAVQTIQIGGSMSTGLRNSGSIYALSDTSGAYAIATWDSGPLINSGIIAARGQISAFAIVAQNPTQIVNQAGGSILAEGGSAVAISLARGNFVQWGFAPTIVGVENHGRIEALSTDPNVASVAISASTDTTSPMLVENYGTISADIAYAGGGWNSTSTQHGSDILNNHAGATIDGAILVDLGNDVITNAGQINGFVDMGEDADLFDSRTGQHAGGTDMGWGDDRFLGGSDADAVTGGRDDDFLSGASGHDLLLGGWGDDRLQGDAGNDGLYGEGGNDALLQSGGDWIDAGDGEDRVELADYQFARVIGGTGNDMLVLPGDGRLLDLGQVVGSGRVSGFEAIQLADNGRIVVRAADVIALSDNDILRVTSAGTGVVDLAGSWAATGSQVIGGVTYSAYSSNGAQLLVAQGLTINLSSQPLGAMGLDSIAEGAAAPTPGSTDRIMLASATTVTNGGFLTSSLEIASGETWTTSDSVVLEGYDTNALTVLNHGLITATGGSRGITAGVLGRIDFLVNNGTISATRLSGTAELAASKSTLATYGIDTMVISATNNAYGARPQGSLSNSGMIRATTDQGIAVAVYNTFNNSGTFAAYSSAFVAVGAWAENGGLMINSGTIEAVGAWAAYGVGSSTHAMTLINSGTIRADATGSGREGIAVYIYYALGIQMVTNSGLIEGDVAIRTLGMVNGNSLWLENSGQVTGRIELNLPFVAGQFIPVREDIIINRGAISGTILLGTGRDVYDGSHGTQVGTVYGQDGSDLLIGTSGADTLDGGSGDDVFFARGGDRLTGGSGSDVFIFSAVTPGAQPEIITDFVSGLDRIDLRAIAPSSVSISGSTISATTALGTLTIQVTGLVAMSDIITGPTSAVSGTAGDDVLVAGPGGTTISGGEGRDLLVGSAGNDRLDGGATWSLPQGEYGDIMWGGAGDDIYVVDSIGDLIVEDLAGGYDTIEITAGLYNFMYEMPAHFERLVGGSGYGNSLDNVMVGGVGADSINGGAGADAITGGGGMDALVGGAGADTFFYGAASDSPSFGDVIYDFEHGVDVVSVASLGPTGLTFQFGYSFYIHTDVVLQTATGAVTIRFNHYVDHSDFGSAFQATNGTIGSDIMLGGALADWLKGGAGNDWLNGGAESDTLHGGDGDDGLVGGAGGDSLFGGAGADRFYFNGLAVSADRIGDFATEDRIYLDASVFAALAEGSLAASAFSRVGQQTEATRIAYDRSNGTIWYDADGFGYGPSESIHIGYVQSDAPITADSFIVYSGNPMPINDVRNDFNGDGRSDILWRNVDGQLSNWLGTATGGFTPNNANAAAVVPVAWQVVGTGDFNGDGRDDILWRHTDGTLSNWLATAAGGYIPNDANAAVVVPTDWHVVGTGDFNGDGRDDILWRNNDGTLSNWLGQANGGFVANDANAAAPVPTAWHVAGTGDFNGDGRDDILWRNTDGQLSNWLGTASGGFTPNNANAAAVVPTAWVIIGTGDFNGDGRDDILWRNTDGTLSNWLGTASGGFTPNDANAAVFVPTAWTVVATGDYNGDGRDDILWRHTDGTLSNWLGTAAGGFTANDANAAAPVPTAWHVQPEPFLF